MLYFATLIALRFLFPIRSLIQFGISALFDTLWSCAFALGIVLIAYTLGNNVLVRWWPRLLDRYALRTTVSFSLGLGLIALVLSWLGLLHLLNVGVISGLVLLSSYFLGDRISTHLAMFWSLMGTLPAQLQKSGWVVRIAVVIALCIGLIALLNTLVPAWDYDGLMYHLTGPREFLDQGGIYPNQAIWYVNGPFSIEMLFTLGLAFGDVLAPKLLHLFFGALYVLSTWGFARRWLGSRSAWIALAILLGMPTLPIWSGFAYIDMAWSLLEWLALAAAVEFFRTRDGGWLTMSAVFLGLALGTKYLALMGLLVIAILYAWYARRKPAAAIASDALSAGLILAGIAGFWYLKNWIWFGNPVYPLYFGGPGWSTERLTLYSDYLKSFGTGLSLESLVTMPVTIFTRHAQFGAVMNRNDILSPLFILAWLYPITRRRQETNILAAAIVFRVGLWVIGSQQIRFLLPIDPAIAILSAYVIADCETRLISWPSLKLFLPSLAVGLMLITLFYQVQLTRQLRPWDVILGRESADYFLDRNVGDYGAARYIQEELPAAARVLLLGDGRSYYCAPKCIPDPDHFRWAALIDSRNPALGLGKIGEQEITHLMVSLEDLDFLLQHDTSGILYKATDRVIEWQSSGMLRKAYSDQFTRILRFANEGE